MKRTYIITLLLSLCSLFTYAQDSFFDKFADMEGVTSVYISKAMLSLMPNMKTEGVNIGEVASKLDNIQILSCEKPDIIAKLKKETAFISPKNGYEELMRINDEGEKTIIYLKRNKNKEKEFVLMSQEKNEFTNHRHHRKSDSARDTRDHQQGVTPHIPHPKAFSPAC